MKADYIEVKAQTRAKLADEVLRAMNQVGPKNVITVVYDEGGKLAGASIFATLKAYVYYIA